MIKTNMSFMRTFLCIKFYPDDDDIKLLIPKYFGNICWFTHPLG